MSLATKPPHPLLARYIAELTARPLRTKAITSGVLCLLQEILASHLSGEQVKRPSSTASPVAHVLAQAKITTKALKMALYGSLVSAPLGHFLYSALQRRFAGKTSAGAKFAQIIASNVLIAPITVTVYLASAAIINGAATVDAILRVVKGGFLPVMKITWISSPLSMVFAQRFLSTELWVPFFNLVGFVLGSVFTTRLKRSQMLQAKKKDEESKRG